MRTRFLLFTMGTLGLTACQTTSEPFQPEILGSWVTDDVPGVIVRMTLGETISISGAGAWVETEDAFAFAVTGALARDEVSLYFDFSEVPDVTFQGYFSDDDMIVGNLNGGAVRQQAVTFEREDLFE
jgi:hypothetical protein